jgi:hypothetical protein
MALANKTVNYTPFNKTSWGFTSGDLSTPHSGLTNAKVVITVKSGTNQWDNTGHISTPTSGSAVASYNKDKFEWSCSGPLADVDAVLVALDLFPADFPAIRNWTNLAVKPNQTTGNFPLYGGYNEEPEQDAPIPDTVFDLKVYDADNLSAGVVTGGAYEITFDAIHPTFGKQRPYWSTVPSNEDASSADFSLSTGGLLNLGEISQLNPTTNVSDTDPLTLTCEFRSFSVVQPPYSGSAYGTLTTTSNGSTNKIFIGDKKPGTENATTRINFTGTRAEVQAYLDNVRYYRCVGATPALTPGTFVPNYTAFDMYFKLSNGVVASDYTKHIYFSDAVIGATTIPSQTYIEDVADNDIDFNITTSNVSPDANTFTATVTLAAPTNGTLATSSSFNASVYGIAFIESFNTSTGVLTITHTSTTDTILLLALSNLVFTPEEDFKDNFNMTVDLTYTGTVNGSSYTSAQQTVAVSGTLSNEVDNQNTTHTWTEDTVYEFSGSALNPRIIHPVNSTFDFELTLSDATAGSLSVPSPTSTYGTMTAGGSGVYTLTGTKTQVNTGLAAMQFIPASDYDSDFTIGFKAERTSGDLTYQEDEWGTYTMTATAVGEYSISQATNLPWLEDVNMTFDSGLAITDTAADDSQLPAYGSNYRVEIAMWYGASEYTDGTIVSNYTTNLTVGGVGNQNGQGDTNMISYTGPKADINTALTTLRFIPNVDFDGQGPYVFYKIVRVSDGAVLTDQASTTKTTFAVGTGHDEYSYTHQSDYDWDEDSPKLFDTGVQITDVADENGDYSQHNSTYTASLQLVKWDTPYTAITTASIGVLTTITGYSNLTITTNSSGTTIQGTKTDVNTALQNLKMIPDMDWLSSPASNGKFFTYIDITRDSDSVVILDGDGNPPVVWVGFEEGTDSTEFVTPTSSFLTFNEDTPKTILNGLTVGITDAAADNFPNITYEFTLSLSDDGITAANTAGEWTGTGSHIKVLTGTKAVVNAAIQALSFTPTMDYSSNPYITFTLKRYVSGSLNQTYTTIGRQVTGTASPLGDYYTGITGMGYTEDLQAQSIFSGHDIGVSDIAADNYSGLTYEVTVTIPSAAGEFVSTGNQTFTTTGTKTAVNTALQNLTFTPTADYNTNFDVTYTQKRYVSGVLDTTHANAVNVGTVTATPVAEFAYGTANSNEQWTTSSNQVPTTTNQVLSPKNLTENWSKTYERPITITDTAEDGGTTNYKIVFTVPTGTTLYDNTDTAFNGTLDWDTKANIHTKLDEGIRISGATAGLSLAFTLYRKLGTNVEDTLATGALTYQFLDIPDDLLKVHHGVHYLAIRPTGLGNNDTLYAFNDALRQTLCGFSAGLVRYSGYSGFQLRIKETDWTNRPSSHPIRDLIDSTDGIKIVNDPFADSNFHHYNNSYTSNIDEVTLKSWNGWNYLPQVFNRDVEVRTNLGTKRVYTNIDFNTIGVSIDFFNGTALNNPPTGFMACSGVFSNFSKTSDTYHQNVNQSNYWDGTYMNVDVLAVKEYGEKALLTNDLSNREFSPVIGTAQPYERALYDGPQGFTYGFHTTKDASNNRFINVIAKDEIAGNQPSTQTYQITDLNAYGSDDDDVSITQVVYDSTNKDIYCLVMAENGSSTKSASIVKLDYNTGTSTYTWSTIKTITLGSSTEYYSIEAFLTDDYSRLITIQSQYNNLAATGIVDIDSSIYTDENRIRVYDKDTGGTDNWGLTTTTNYSTSNQQTLTKKKRGLHDVNYGDINGSDTVITNFGHIFKKDTGGTDNWGRSGQLDLTQTNEGDPLASGTKRLICHYTNNYIICVGSYSVYDGSSQLAETIAHVFHKTNFNRLGEDQYLMKWASVMMIETSRSHDHVGVLGIDKDPTTYSPNHPHRDWMMINLTT